MIVTNYPYEGCIYDEVNDITICGPLVIGGDGKPTGIPLTSTHELKPPFPW